MYGRLKNHLTKKMQILKAQMSIAWTPFLQTESTRYYFSTISVEILLIYFLFCSPPHQILSSHNHHVHSHGA